MTEKQLRNLYVSTAKKYLGYNEADGSHKVIVDLYNTIKPLPVGYKVTYTDEWCATFVSAMAQECGLTDIIFPECGCGRMRDLYIDAGRWMEDDSYTPSPGDLIIYDWDDDGEGDNTGKVEHVGIIASVSGSTMKVLEGNKGDSVSYRTKKVNSRYIRGFCLPDYASKATPDTVNKSEVVSGNFYLTQAQMQINARYIYQVLSAKGWTLNAIAGMLGNMETESTINPGIWQSLDEGDTSSGYGLVQWTPATKYLDWCTANGLEPSDMDSALARIEAEVENGWQYYKTDAYPLTFSQFKVSTESANYLGMAFLANYERPANPNQTARGEQAEYWYNYLSDFSPGSGDSGGGGGDSGDNDEPVTPSWKPSSKRKMALLLMVAGAKRSG